MLDALVFTKMLIIITPHTEDTKSLNMYRKSHRYQKKNKTKNIYNVMNHVTCVKCHASCVICHGLRVTCHLSPVICPMSPVTCHLSPDHHSLQLLCESPRMLGDTAEKGLVVKRVFKKIQFSSYCQKHLFSFREKKEEEKKKKKLLD